MPQKIKTNQLDLSAEKSAVSTAQSTTSTAFTNLATAQSVTITIGSSGKALVHISSGVGNNTAGQYGVMCYEMSGANTSAASDNNGVYWRSTVGVGGGENSLSKTFLLTGLNAGSTTFTLKFRVTGGTGNFERREISAIAL